MKRQSSRRRRRGPGALARTPLGMAMILVATAMMLARGAPAAAQDWQTITSSRQIWSSAPLSVRVDYGSGDLNVRPTSDLLYRMEIRYDEDSFSPITDFDEEARTLHLGVRATRDGRNLDVDNGSSATIALTDRLPLDVELNFGAGKAHLELGGLRLRNVDMSLGATEADIHFSSPNPIRAEHVSIKAGAAKLEIEDLGNTRAERFDFQGGVGATTLGFGGAWNHDAVAIVQIGVGSLTLRIPRGLGVRIDKSSFLTNFDSEGLVRRGEDFYSTDWDRAAHKLTIDVRAALGSIDVEWID